MAFWKIIALACATIIFVEAKYYQKRDIKSNICDPAFNNTNEIQCYCGKDPHEPALIKSAECYLTKESIKKDDLSWQAFRDIKDASKLTLTNSRGITLKYIPSIAIVEMKSLSKLVIRHCHVEDLNAFAFANSSSIAEITLRDNHVKVLEVNAFAHHKALSVISLDTNNIVEINRDVFVDLPHLKKLYLTSNKITTIHDRAFVQLMNLRELEIDRNNLFSLNSETFSGLQKLEKLDLSGNSLEVIGDNTFLPLVGLLSLNLGDNKIQMLDGKAFNGLTQLRSLSLGRNNLTDIDNIKTFEPLKSLVTLSLKANQIRELKPEVMAPVLNNFYGNISSLDVEDNIFPCNCRLDWFFSLMNKTQNSHLKLSLENLKCIPDAKLKEEWSKVQEAEKAEKAVSEETPGQNLDYEYYDDTELDGKLFYIDVRDLLNCSSKGILEENLETTQPTTKKYMIDSVKIVTSTEIAPKSEQAEVALSEVSTTKRQTELVKNDITTTRLATVSAKPIEKDIYDHEMPSDEAKPDKVKAHRSIQDPIQASPKVSNNAQRNIGCVILYIVIHCTLILS